jgi:hypothetical protein
MIITIFVLFFVPFGSCALTFDWSVDPTMTHAVKITNDLLVDGQSTRQRILFITLANHGLDLDPFFQQLPPNASVSVLSWKVLAFTTYSKKFQYRLELIVMILVPELQVSHHNLSTNLIRIVNVFFQIFSYFSNYPNYRCRNLDFAVNAKLLR